jgi:hypothetical protein
MSIGSRIGFPIQLAFCTIFMLLDRKKVDGIAYKEDEKPEDSSHIMNKLVNK